MVESGLTGSPVLSLLVFEENLYAGMNAGGVWKYPLSLITGIYNTETNTNLDIYPNPATNTITIATDQVCSNSFISVYSMTGQELIKQDIGHSITQIDISNLLPGIYLVKYNCKDWSAIKRFIKK
jgi:hypothetical protein